MFLGASRVWYTGSTIMTYAVERTFAWLGNFRRLLVRHERYLSTFRGFCLIAFVLVLLRYF
jgi:transposase